MFRNNDRGWIGVDLGGATTKVAQLRRTSDRLILSASATSVGASTQVRGDQVRSAKVLAGDLRGSQAAAVLSMSSSTVEPAGEEQSNAVGVCASSWSAGEALEYALSTPAEEVEGVVDTLTSVGWDCEVVDGPPLAIARVLQLSPGYRPDRLLGAIDWGESAVTFVAAKQGVAVYARRLRCDGFASIRERVAKSLSLTPTEAEEALTSCPDDSGVHSGAHRFVEERLVDAVRPVLNELRRTLEHLGGKLKSPPPERLYLMGVGGTVACFPKLVSDALGAPAEPWTAANVDRTPGAESVPDCLLAQAIALSALAWESA